MHKTISFELSEKSINKAIQELKLFREDFLHKIEFMRQRIADDIAINAQFGFDSSDVERSWIGGVGATNVSRKADVKVDVNEESGDVTVVVAHGDDAVWVEFGTGVHYNGNVGNSPNPLGGKLGLTIGSYGQRNGQYDVWRYYENGEIYSTHGVPATMPMYNSAMDVINRINSIAQEVFG